MAATLTLTFTDVGVDDEYIDITGGGITITFKPSRYSNKKVAIKEDIATQVKAFYDSFTADYNNNDDYVVTYDETTVTIEHPDNTHFDSLDDGSSTITTSIATTTATATYSLSSITYTANASPCFYTTLGLTFTISLGVTITELKIERKEIDGTRTVVYHNETHNSNTYSGAHTREPYIWVRVTAYIQGIARYFYLTPPTLLAINSVVIAPGPFSSIVTIISNVFLGSTENTYALTEPGVTPVYQSSNTFSGIIPGTYYATVKDKYNCTETQEVVVLEGGNYKLNSYNAFASIKNSNCFADRNVANSKPGGATSFLSYDNPFNVTAGEFRQVFPNTPTIVNQFKSNFVRNEVKLLTLCETNPLVIEDEQELDVIQRTDNITRDSYLEAYYDEDPDTLSLRLRFFSGDDIYDANGNVIGQHDYDGVLPDFYEIGTNLKIELYDGVIVDIYESVGVTYALTNIGSLGSGKVTVHSIHQELDYDVFEFTVDHENLTGTEYQIEIKGYLLQNTTTVSSYFLSERAKVIDRDSFLEQKYHECYFWSDNNDAEIDYTPFGSTDFTRTDQKIDPQPIKHYRAIKFANPLQPISSADIETQGLDEKEVKIDAKTKRVFESNFEAVPSLYAGSLMKLFDESDYVQIDELLYTSISPASIEHKGQYATVKVNLALIGGNNESQITNKTIKRFYPVVT